ncbi:unnamed protein product [Rotaria magnacalcarata]
MLHSNMIQLQTFVSTYRSAVNMIEMPPASMINRTVASTPVSASAKRGRNDTNGVSESNTQVRPQYPQTNRIFDRNDNIQQPISALCRFATTRFPFSPFSVIFSQEVRDKVVIDDLTKHASEHLNFDFSMVAYRRGRAENNECRILIFVENSESFVFLNNQENWSTSLSGSNYTKERPSIPPELALVIPAVSLRVDWEEFMQELKNVYPGIINVIRLKNRAQQSIRVVKLEFMLVKTRGDILEAREITVSHLKYKVVGFYAQASVLICSNCCGIGHFRKSCPQKNEVTCKTCGEKCANMKDHLCSDVPKCIHCGGAHVSNDSKFKIVQQYRTTLTRNLLSNVIPVTGYNSGPDPARSNNQRISSTTNKLFYANVYFNKMEEESNATRQSLIELKKEIRSCYVETKQQVEELEEKVKSMEKKFEDISVRTCAIIQNICSYILEPQKSQGNNWKLYWQDQIKILVEVRSSLSKSTQ